MHLNYRPGPQSDEVRLTALPVATARGADCIDWRLDGQIKLRDCVVDQLLAVKIERLGELADCLGDEQALSLGWVEPEVAVN